MGYVLAIFNFFLSALRSIRNYVYVLTFAPCGIHTNMEILLHTYNIITRIRDFVLRLEQTRTNTGKNIIFRRYCSLQKEARKIDRVLKGGGLYNNKDGKRFYDNHHMREYILIKKEKLLSLL